jgi:branched-chain amino acid transport system permease protein
MGGWGSLRGAVAGALIVSIFEVLVPSLPVVIPVMAGAQSLFSPTASTIWLYLAFLIVLFFRPQGLFGEAVQQRA